MSNWDHKCGVILAKVSRVGGIECKIWETGHWAMVEVAVVGVQGDLGGGETRVSSFYVVDCDDVHSGCGRTPAAGCSLDQRHVQGRAAPLKWNALPGEGSLQLQETVLAARIYSLIQAFLLARFSGLFLYQVVLPTNIP